MVSVASRGTTERMAARSFLKGARAGAGTAARYSSTLFGVGLGFAVPRRFGSLAFFMPAILHHESRRSVIWRCGYGLAGGAGRKDRMRAVAAWWPPEDAMSGMKHLLRVLAICWLGLASAAARGQGKPDRITAWDDFNIQLAEDPQISPDGKEIVYVREFADVMTDQRYTN